MRKSALIVMTAAVFSTSPISVKWSADKKLSVSQDNALRYLAKYFCLRSGQG
jgi:hypothetical protein